MNFTKYVKYLFFEVERLDSQISKKSERFSKKEFSEILQVTKKCNEKYLNKIIEIESLSFFDVSYILSSVNLNDEKIATIKKATSLFNANKFKEFGQTYSDFIFRVLSNLDLLNTNNLDIFSELVQVKNDVYDFSNLMKNPSRYIKKSQKTMNFQFEKVFY